jgi:hypothetical protein
MVPSERAAFVPSARETGVSVVTVRGKAVPPVVPPTVIFPEALTWTLCVPPVVIATVSAAGKCTPVFVSPVVVIDGAVAVPAGKVATPVNVGLLIAPAAKIAAADPPVVMPTWSTAGK